MICAALVVPAPFARLRCDSSIASRRALVAILSVVGIGSMTMSARADEAPPPWQRTETRADCADYSSLRSPFFGETHTHTAYSSDAVVGGTVAGPREAYRFAKGEAMALPTAYGVFGRTTQLRRPLDFAVVTDHAEQFGEMPLCLEADSAGYASTVCSDVRDQLASTLPTTPAIVVPNAFINLLSPYMNSATPARFSWCGAGGTDCLARSSIIWDDTQAAAEEHYDRTDACTFTSFVGYEWTGTPNGFNIHRNIVFRNEAVPALPITYLEETTVQGLWGQLDTQCTDAGTGCDALTIPHNSNASGGLIFTPANADGSALTAADAARRAHIEPLVELINHKGESECQPGNGTTDELCAFEKSWRPQLFSLLPLRNPVAFNNRNFIRNVLKEGLAEEERMGINPFRLGFVGGTDTHNATPGAVNEQDWGTAGHAGLRDRQPNFILTQYAPSGIPTNPSGLAVLWAEENSRDSLFEAMRRREAYTTSGPRPIVRFFAGELADVACGSATFVEDGYRGGVPMGGEIGPESGGRSPKFALLALRDVEEGSPLQHIQMIKGWVDDDGAVQEKVFEVTGDPDNGATVDTDTCTPSGDGFDSLCAVWTDPEFDRHQRAFYYARVLENPSCRWSTYVCNAAGIDCANAASVPADFAQCCNSAWPKAIQERAWTSPVWYRPEAIGKVNAKILPARGQLNLKVVLGELPAGITPDSDDIVVRLADDGAIWEATIPAGTLDALSATRWLHLDEAATNAGIKKALFVRNASGQATLTLQAMGLDLGSADLVEHMLTLEVSVGDAWTSRHTRRWASDGKKLFWPPPRRKPA